MNLSVSCPWMVDFLLFEERLGFTHREASSLLEVLEDTRFLFVHVSTPLLYLSLQFPAIDIQHILLQEETCGLWIVSLMTTLKGQKHSFLSRSGYYTSFKKAGFSYIFHKEDPPWLVNPDFSDPSVQRMQSSTSMCSATSLDWVGVGGTPPCELGQVYTPSQLYTLDGASGIGNERMLA